MGKKIDAGQAVKEFCNAWFAMGEPDRAAEFLDSDVCFVGAGDREYARGKQEVLDYIRRDTEKTDHAFDPEVSVIYEQPLSEEIFSLSCRMVLKSEAYTWQMGGHFTLALYREQWRIKNMCLTDTGGSHEELLHIYNNIPGAVFRCRFDKFFSVIEGNDGLFEFLGYTRQEFAAMGNRMSSVIYPDDLEIMTDKLRVQLKYGNTIHNENRLICKGGSVKWISIKAQLLTEKSGEQYFYCVFVDITEEKQMQERSRRPDNGYQYHLSNADARTIPIIAMTANAFDDDIEKSKAAGMNAHLAKPARLFQTLYVFIFKSYEAEKIIHCRRREDGYSPVRRQ